MLKVSTNKQRSEHAMLNTMMIGNKIQEARKNKNLSQTQLATQLSITSQAVGKWERGESMPDIITLNHLAEILGVDLNYFSENFKSKTAEKSPEPERVRNINMSGWNWVDADFSGLRNLQTKFSASNMLKCLFVRSYLSGLVLKSNNVVSCDFSESDVSSSQIKSSNLVGSQFVKCNLQDTFISSSQLKNCDFTGSDFTGATLKYSSLMKCNVSGAVWIGTTFNGTQLSDIIFDSDIQSCSFENCDVSKTTFKNLTLTDTFFKGKSLKKIKFIECKTDKITYAFLKNGKADVSGITIIEE